MKEEDYINELHDIVRRSGDPEQEHSEADGLMLKVIRDAGFNRLADQLQTASNSWWYA